MAPPVYLRYLGIHYAGAETPDSGLKNLRVYSATPETPPRTPVLECLLDRGAQSS